MVGGETTIFMAAMAKILLLVVPVATFSSAAKVRVVIESRDAADVWGTVGVSENIIEASWLALCDSIEYKLFKDAEAGK